MKLQRVDRLVVSIEAEVGRRVRVGRLALDRKRILFEYDQAFLGSRLELSPFKLPLRPGVVVGDTRVFDGLMGVFDDSLPDGWGRLLIDRRAAELGVAAGALTPLDRLAVVGARSIGALVYEPELQLDDPSVVSLAELARDAETVLRDARGADLERLIAVGGSPQGARPKVLVQLSPTGEVLAGAKEIRAGNTAWLVKFPPRDDDRAAGRLERAYFLMAEAAGLDVPRTQLLDGTQRRAGYFAIERFDRQGSRRIHAHTLGGLLQLPHGYPALDYLDLLSVTRELTRDEQAVREMFRRACFNVFAHNRDDHARNFSFLMSETGAWRPSPAYDLTFTSGPGGEHTLLVAGHGRAPAAPHLTELATRADLKRPKEVIDTVRSAVSRFAQFADQAEVPPATRKRVATMLGVPSR